jgi:large subunit ribosomal protein L29
MKASELRQQKIHELDKIKLDLFHEQFNLRLQKSTGQLNKTDKLIKVRRNIARVKAILAEMRKQS